MTAIICAMNRTPAGGLNPPTRAALRGAIIRTSEWREVVFMDSRSGDAQGPTASGRESDSTGQAESPTIRESLVSPDGGPTGPATRQVSTPTGAAFGPLSASAGRGYVVCAPDGAEVWAWIPQRALGLLGPILRRNGFIVLERSDCAQT